MNLNELIYGRLSSLTDLSKKLAEYQRKPAIFNSEFPFDQQAGWEGKSQYPRICYRIDMQANQERSSAGTLHVSIYTERDLRAADELETLVKMRLKDVLMKPSGEAPFCVSWAKTEPYLLEGNAVLCKDVIFDILQYPGQQTTDPDPVLAVSMFVKEAYPDSVVLGVDRIGDYTNPADTPVFYCRLEDIQGTEGHCMNTISWFNCKIAVHLLCPNADDRLKMIAAIHQRLEIEGEIIMLDQSPMTVKDLRMNNKADYLREGQLLITGKYGCLRGGEKKANLTGVGIGF